MNITARNIQLTPTLWKRVSVREDGEEDAGVFGTFAEILDITMPLVLGKTPIELGCGCSDNCPSPKVFIDTSSRKGAIEAYARFVDFETARADDLHLNLDGNPACGAVIPDPDDIPGCQIKRMILPEYWDHWDGQRCPDCESRFRVQRTPQQQQQNGSPSDAMPLPEAFGVSTELLFHECCTVQGYANLKEFGGVLSVEFPGTNGESVWEIRCHAQAGEKIDDLPAFAIYIQFNGWPAGIVDAGGGTIAAGELANEGSFIDAVRAELARRNVEV